MFNIIHTQHRQSHILTWGNKGWNVTNSPKEWKRLDQLHIMKGAKTEMMKWISTIIWNEKCKNTEQVSISFSYYYLGIIKQHVSTPNNLHLQLYIIQTLTTLQRKNYRPFTELLNWHFYIFWLNCMTANNTITNSLTTSKHFYLFFLKKKNCLAP